MTAEVMAELQGKTDPDQPGVSVVVLDRGDHLADDGWLTRSGPPTVRVVSRSHRHDEVAAQAAELTADAVVVVVGETARDDDHRLIAELSDRPVLAVVAHADAVATAQLLRAGAMGVVTLSELRADGPGPALRALSDAHVHVSAVVAGALAAGLRDQRLDIAGERPPRLTRRERSVMLLVADGLTNGQIADRLGVSRKTVKNHLTNIYAKLGVAERSAAIRSWRRDPAASDS